MNRHSVLKKVKVFAAGARNKATKVFRRLAVMSTEKRIAVGTLVVAVLTLVVAAVTLGYMHHHDFEVETRSGWTEIHEAMVNLRVQRTLVMEQRGAMGAYGPAPNPFVERKRDYDTAEEHLRGLLDRMSGDPLVVELVGFLESNKQIERWETDEYEKTFDGFADKVAMKARPK